MESSQTDIYPYLVAGAAGLLTCLVIHHFWIQHIWFIAPAGLIAAGLGGLAVGWSYAEIQGGLPPRPILREFHSKE